MPTVKLTNQLFQQYPGSGSSNGDQQPPSLESATFVSVVSAKFSCLSRRCPFLFPHEKKETN